MPFYNGVKTVIRALNSIYQIALPIEEFEVIVVDDFSPVPAKEVLSNYEKTHRNLYISRHSENTRQGGAKNTGMALAKGKYIAFIDQDDMINPINMCLAINKAVELNVDVLSCFYSILEENENLNEVRIKRPDATMMYGVDFCELYYDVRDSIGPWSYLYRTDYVRMLNHPMKEKVLLEDPDWTIWHLVHAQTIYMINESIYIWIMNPYSITHSTHKYVNRVDWIRAGLRKIEDAQKYKSISPIFAEKITIDGRWNIQGSFRKLWKINNYYAFYLHLSSMLKTLQNMHWRGVAKLYIRYPRLSIVFLYLIGTPLKCINYVRQKFFC